MPFGMERDPTRVVAFSDGVMAISVTLLVLELRPPEDTRHLLHGLLTLWPSYLAYIVTFMLVGRCGPTITSCSTKSAAPTGWCCS
jgi:TMEM175 potassium channel family protein